MLTTGHLVNMEVHCILFFIFSVSLNCFQNEVIKNKNALGKKDNFTTKMF